MKHVGLRLEKSLKSLKILELQSLKTIITKIVRVLKKFYLIKLVAELMCHPVHILK